ncbi:MAG: ATP-NAD kinase family protein, partial [Chloroflexi bacterium]|nr:ATP-NAD kinase family protein [Chloroflexota bacterium]
MKTLGLIVNPIAGMGGSVGLKGTDGEDTPQRALSLGAEPQASKRSYEALSIIGKAMPELSLVTCAGKMGEDTARSCGLTAHIIEDVPQDGASTSSADTRRAALELQRLGVDLLLFAGGDGTARDICDALRTGGFASAELPVLGIPAGVKMHSGVFALTPRKAGETALHFLNDHAAELADVEVMDIDEDAFREGRVSATLHGYLKTPMGGDGVQATKSGAAPSDSRAAEDIARQVVADMADDTLYIIGPGTTTAAIARELGVANTLLGVDVVANGKLLAADATERDLLRLTDGRSAKIVVTVIGGQGYIFGRGNQQIGPRVIRRIGRENIVVVA